MTQAQVEEITGPLTTDQYGYWLLDSQNVSYRFWQSGYRTPQYNTKVGGVAHSQHCYGTAADISVKGQTPAAVAAYARELMPDWGGVGVYAGQGFTHIDVRETRADWMG